MSKNSLSTLFLVCAVGLSYSPTFVNAETVSEAIVKCKSEQNSLQRLLCFDKIADNISDLQDQSFAEARANAPQPAVTTGNVTAGNVANDITRTTNQQQDDFGRAPVDDTPDELSSNVTKVETDRLRRQTMTLQNGQVWREVGSSGHKVENGQDVTVKKGLFGSYYLSVEGSNRQLQVKRIR